MNAENETRVVIKIYLNSYPLILNVDHVYEKKSENQFFFLHFQAVSYKNLIQTCKIKLAQFRPYLIKVDFALRSYIW